uniref:Uncharacterized protein n=1 Tax=Solanum tuberosum TaxID=4113 RepID=M1C4A7_SOLTU
MISINLETDWIEDLEYNAVDHMEKQEFYVNSMKQEIFEDVYTSDMVASIEEIKEVDHEHAVFETMYANGNLYVKNIEKDLGEVEFSNQSPAISRSFTSLDKILKANGDDEDQIDVEDGCISGETNGMTFKISKVDNQIIEELERKFGSGSYYGVESSQMKSPSIVELH